MVVVGDDIARRPQPVAVQRGADLPPIGESDRRRPVPRLHQRGVILIESLALRIHQRVAGPCLGDQQHHGVRQRVAAGHQDFQRVVDARGVGLAVRNDRPHLVEVGPDQRQLHRPPARVHPVHVAAHRVDLTVMGEEPIRMRQPPGRERVGGEPLMHQRQRRLGQRIAPDPYRTTRPASPAAVPCRPSSWSRTTACTVRSVRAVRLRSARPRTLFRICLRIARILRSNASWSLIWGLAGDDGLADDRHAVDHRLPQTGQIGRHVAPPHHGSALPGRPPARTVRWHRRGLFSSWGRKHIATAYSAGLGRRFAGRARPIGEQTVGHLDQAAGAVAHQRVRADRAAMIQVLQDFQALAR